MARRNQSRDRHARAHKWDGRANRESHNKLGQKTPFLTNDKTFKDPPAAALLHGSADSPQNVPENPSDCWKFLLPNPIPILKRKAPFSKDPRMARMKFTATRARPTTTGSSSSRTPSPSEAPNAPPSPAAPPQPAPVPNEMGFVTHDNLELERYNRLLRRTCKCTRSIDWNFFEEMGLKSNFRTYLRDLGLLRLSDLREDTYRNLTLEFLSSLQIVRKAGGVLPWGTLRFRLKDVDRHLTPAEFGRLFQVPHEGSPEVDREFPMNEFWSSLVGREEVFIKEGNASQMVSPQDRMLHAFLVGTLTFRGSSTHKVTKEDLFLLWCFKEGYPVDAVGWIMYRMYKTALKDKGDIVIGGYVTCIARHFEIALDEDDECHRISFVDQQNGIRAKVLEGARVVKKLPQLDKYGRVQYQVIGPDEPVANRGQAQKERPAESSRSRRTRAGSSRQSVDIETTMAEMMAMMQRMDTGIIDLCTRVDDGFLDLSTRV